MDTTITSEPTETGSGTAVTEEPGQTTGGESAASQSTEGASKEGGSSQESAEGSQGTSEGRRGSSLYRDVIKLRTQNRELREQAGSVEQLRQDLALLREELSRRNQPNPAKDPSKFWQDPEGTLDSKLDERLERLQNNLFERFSQSREQEYAAQALRQEQESATEFIRTQKGYDPSDDEELADIIMEIPKQQLLHMAPQVVAEWAWYKLQQSRGVGDRTLAKQRASGVQGQPPGVGFGRKTWNKAEYDQAVDLVADKLQKNPNDPEMTKLYEELVSAHRENRVR